MSSQRAAKSLRARLWPSLGWALLLLLMTMGACKPNRGVGSGRDMDAGPELAGAAGRPDASDNAGEGGAAGSKEGGAAGSKEGGAAGSEEGDAAGTGNGGAGGNSNGGAGRGGNGGAGRSGNGGAAGGGGAAGSSGSSGNGGAAGGGGAAGSGNGGTTAAHWQTARLLETDDRADTDPPQLAVNAQGDAVAIWTQSNFSSISLYANHYTKATGWGEAEVIPTHAAGSRSVNDPSVAIDREGNVTALWDEDFSVWANRYTVGAGWGTAVRMAADTGEAANPQVAVDGAGNAIVVFWQHHGETIDIMSNRYVAGVGPGTGWGTAVAIEAVAGDATAPRIAIDGAGNAIAVWIWSDGLEANFGYNLWSNRYVVGEGWGAATAIGNSTPGTNNTVSDPPDVAVDTGGDAFAVWQEVGVEGYSDIWSNRYRVGAGWGTAVLLEHDNLHSDGAQVAIDADGNAMAVWAESNGSHGHVLASRYVAGTGWGSPVPIESDEAGPPYAPQLVIDGNGNATVLCSKRNSAAYTNNIWTNRYTPATGWGQAFILDGTDDPATDVQIGVDGSGDVLAVWQQNHFVRSIWADAYTSAGSP